MVNFIIAIVFCLVIHASVFFLLRYCFDEVNLWQDEDDDFKLDEPSVLDFSLTVPDDCYDSTEGIDYVEFSMKHQTAFDLKNRYIVDRYVRERIYPAYYYFALRKELVSLNSEATNSALPGYLLIPALLIFLTTRFLRGVGFTESTFLCGAIALGVFVTGAIAASFVYRRRLKIPSFRKSKADLRKFFEGSTKEYDVSDEAALNSHIIAYHLHYLNCIKDTMRKRKTARCIVFSVAVTVLILFGGTI